MYCNYHHPQQIKDVVKSVEDEDIENLRFYLADGADPDMRDEHGLGLLHIAAKDGRTEAVDTLLEFGADPNLLVSTTQHTPIFYASRSSSGPLIELLVNNGANIEAVDGCGWKPLHMAAGHGDHVAVKALITAGANVQALTRNGETPRALAERRYENLHQENDRLVCECLRQAEAALDVEGQKHEQVERDIALLKRHNPKQFRLKF